MTKKEAKEKVEGQLKNVLSAIDKIDDRLISLGFDIRVIFLNEEPELLFNGSISLDEMLSVVHEARKVAPFKLDFYWMSLGMVNARYICAGQPSLNFYYLQGDATKIIDVLSGGKCRIETITKQEQSIICETAIAP